MAEMGWAAGIIDGEGCIYIRRYGARYYSLGLKVTMGHEPTIRRLRELFGVGSVVIVRSKKGHNDAWSWVCTTRQAERVLTVLRPLLFTKADEVDLAMEFLRLPVQPGTARVPPEIMAERQRLLEAIRDAKPSARFRVPT